MPTEIHDILYFIFPCFHNCSKKDRQPHREGLPVLFQHLIECIDRTAVILMKRVRIDVHSR